MQYIGQDIRAKTDIITFEKTKDEPNKSKIVRMVDLES